MLLTSEFRPKSEEASSHQPVKQKRAEVSPSEKSNSSPQKLYPTDQSSSNVPNNTTTGVSRQDTFHKSPNRTTHLQQYPHRTPTPPFTMQPSQSQHLLVNNMMLGQHATTPYPQQGYYYLPPDPRTLTPASSSSHNHANTKPNQPVMILYYPYTCYQQQQQYQAPPHINNALPVQPIPSNRISVPDWENYQFPPTLSTQPSTFTGLTPSTGSTSCNSTVDIGHHIKGNTSNHVASLQQKKSEKSAHKLWHGLPSDVLSSSSDDSGEDDLDGVGEYDTSDDENDDADEELRNEKKKNLPPSLTKSFKLTATRRNHERSQLDQRPFSCIYNNCDLSFRRKPDLQRHVKSCHEKVKNFACGDCGRSFARSDALKRHREARTKGNLPCIGLKYRRV